MDFCKDLLAEEVERELHELSKTEVGSEKANAITKNVVQLYELGLKHSKQKSDEEETMLLHEQECRLKSDEIAEKKKDRWWRVALELIGTGVSLGTLGVWAAYVNRGFKFEESGSFTSKTFLSYVQKINPFKK